MTLSAVCLCLAAVARGRAEQPAGFRNITLVGSLQLAPFNQKAHGDVAAYKHLAFVGKWGSVCTGTGVDIIDISTPSTPVKVAATTGRPGTSTEDMKAIQIGTRDVLAVGLQECGPDPAQGASGLELYDITEPNDPRLLSFFDVDALGADVHGIHELDLTTTPSGRALALAAVPHLEVGTAGAGGLGGVGDLLIIDVTYPTKPTLVAEWGVLDEPGLGLAFYESVRQGSSDRTFLHSARAGKDGTRAYLSYWDAGVIVLDITDPARPAYLGRTSFAPADEGNAHSVAEARGGNVLVQADEDTDPFAGDGEFNGWGYLRFFDISDPSNPVLLGTFATANANDEAVAAEGNWSAHNPEVRGNTVYASWYNDGVRVIDISATSAPREVASWTGAGTPAGAPAVNIWGVAPHQNLLLASDRNYGLYILRVP
ncbi:MAG TPA: hypothetical protein VF064_09230 [Pyrinomonadaceae bacterium]